MSQQLKKSGAPLLGVAKSIYYLFVTKYKVQRLNCIVENFLKMCCFVMCFMRKTVTQLCGNCCSGIVILGRASTKHIEVFQL